MLVHIWKPKWIIYLRPQTRESHSRAKKSYIREINQKLIYFQSIKQNGQENFLANVSNIRTLQYQFTNNIFSRRL